MILQGRPFFFCIHRSYLADAGNATENALLSCPSYGTDCVFFDIERVADSR